MRMVSEAMFELMMHMIGYGNLTSNFVDVATQSSYDGELILELATWCDDRWGTDIVGELNKIEEEWI
jgi:hypothetical protein